MRLYVTALNPNDSLTQGFLPAARALGCEVTLLTDQPERHAGVEALRTDVRDARAVIDAVARHHRPDAIFSASDHVQPETALAAAYFGLPGKDWRACLTAKNKALTRRALAAAGVEQVRSATLPPGQPPPGDLPFPVVVKPREGVASEEVMLATDAGELARALAGIRERRPGATLVAEEYLEGPLRTLETLGDGHALHVLGGFRTTLGPLPHFIEERLDWNPAAAETATGAGGRIEAAAREHVLRALAAVGVGFGACHTEYALTAHGPRIIEINYRLIGDNCDFLLAELLGVPLFEQILRVHLGEPAQAPPSVTGHGAAVSLVAPRSGVVKSGPGEVAETIGGVRLRHRPLRAPGDTVELTHTNRDYLGVVRAAGPDRAAVDHALASFRARTPWVVE
ncbi:carboxylate--amine ligase [Sphaerisporangium melleum]|uniref:Carboxylate--amine ligase n=1 Tax=Sphaerisporangium melleum TaxID=321316 RepID=A0A917RIB1_9ACTN|nr:siderophore biosynthesis protein [Sphaerisporangium melleum]GGL08913.1 carboxylate--amine ligase [Sphaerisporangium melleum]GII68769.1 carboxylate--amine ligase [Sphaerisporangium melleum]